MSTVVARKNEGSLRLWWIADFEKNKRQHLGSSKWNHVAGQVGARVDQKQAYNVSKGNCLVEFKTIPELVKVWRYDDPLHQRALTEIARAALLDAMEGGSEAWNDLKERYRQGGAAHEWNLKYMHAVDYGVRGWLEGETFNLADELTA